MPPANPRRNTFFVARARRRTALQRNSKNGLKLRVIRKSRSFVFLPELAQNGTLFDGRLLVTIVAFFGLPEFLHENSSILPILT